MELQGQFDSLAHSYALAEALATSMENWSISLERAEFGRFSSLNHNLVTIRDFMDTPVTAIDQAVLQKFAVITPQYPGIRAPLEFGVCEQWLEALTPLLNSAFDEEGSRWSMQAWYSIVTRRPEDLMPIQRFPHVDGTNPRQLAMMLYLHTTGHGGTAFFRQRATGLESLTDETFPRYRAALEQGVRETGLPAPSYPTDGEPLFEKTYQSSGEFNQAIFYRGNILHSGVIDCNADLPSDPRRGRLTINAFFQPV